MFIPLFSPMATSQFIIKVSDLLHNAWQKDVILFEGKQSSILPYRSPTWIDTQIEIIWLNDIQLSVEADYIETTLVHECARCANEFEKHYLLEWIEAKWLIVKKAEASELDPDIIPINAKNYILDTEQWLVDNILMSTDVRQLCTACEKQDVDEHDDMLDTVNIIWTKAK